MHLLLRPGGAVCRGGARVAPPFVGSQSTPSQASAAPASGRWLCLPSAAGWPGPPFRLPLLPSREMTDESSGARRRRPASFPGRAFSVSVRGALVLVLSSFLRYSAGDTRMARMLMCRPMTRCGIVQDRDVRREWAGCQGETPGCAFGLVRLASSPHHSALLSFWACRVLAEPKWLAWLGRSVRLLAGTLRLPLLSSAGITRGREAFRLHLRAGWGT
jgi:hypothetical protein